MVVKLSDGHEKMVVFCCVAGNQMDDISTYINEDELERSNAAATTASTYLSPSCAMISAAR